MTLSALGIFSAAGAGGVAATGGYELIESQILGTSAASITFSNLGSYSSTYKHLQLRTVAQNSTAAVTYIGIRFNADSGTTYGSHWLRGNASSGAVDSGNDLNATNIFISRSTNGINAFDPAVVDILDAFSTTKNKTVRSLTGAPQGSVLELYLTSGLWRNTNGITSLTVIPRDGSNLTANSRFSLYGIR